MSLALEMGKEPEIKKCRQPLEDGKTRGQILLGPFRLSTLLLTVGFFLPVKPILNFSIPELLNNTFLL